MPLAHLGTGPRTARPRGSTGTPQNSCDGATPWARLLETVEPRLDPSFVGPQRLPRGKIPSMIGDKDALGREVS
jgi:hypothetical protein